MNHPAGSELFLKMSMRQPEEEAEEPSNSESHSVNEHASPHKTYDYNRKLEIDEDYY